MYFKSVIFSLLAFFILINGYHSFAQKDYWKILFPGFDYSLYKANIDHEDNLHLALKSTVQGQPNKFISIDKNGFVIFQSNTNELPLLHFHDSTGNKYLVSWLPSTLIIKKYNSQQTLLWSTNYIVTNAVTVQAGGIVSEFEFIRSANYFLNSAGHLLISGIFKTDTVPPTNFSTLCVFIFNSGNGQYVSTYYNNHSQDPITETRFQEDLNGNINVIYYNSVTDVYLRKFNLNGTEILQQKYGDYSAGNEKITSVKVTDNYIYLGYEINYGYHVVKVSETLLDTVFHIHPGYNLDFIDFVDANDSTYIISHDIGNSTGLIQVYDYYGNLVCSDGSSSYYNLSYRVFLNNQSIYSVRQALGVSNIANCLFSTATANFDNLTWELLIGFIETPNYPRDNYIGQNITYSAGRIISSDVFGIVGIIDARRNNFSGKVYFDLNNNCQPDSAESGLINQLIQISPQGIYIFTNNSGIFENRLDTGTYTLSLIPFSPVLSVCPSAHNITITDTTTMINGNHFGVQGSSAALQDLGITLNQLDAVPGFSSRLFLKAMNYGPLPASGYIKLSVDTSIFNLNGFTSNITPDSISGNSVYWSVNNLGLYASVNISALMPVFQSVVAGTAFTTEAHVVNYLNETNILNNYDFFQSVVVSSFDPNDKHVYPTGYGNAGIISPLDTLLRYKIQFQNTGTHSAYNIFIIDSIDSNLDISTFKLQSTRHACKVSFLAPNVLLFKFDNILLPTATANEPLSHGFINYTIETVNGLPLHTEIRNKASIYFDFNPPIVTNEVLNTIGSLNTSSHLKTDFLYLFPNPSKGFFSVKSEYNINKIAVYSLQGEEVLSAFPESKNVNFEIQKEGFYIIKLFHNKSIVTKKLLVVKD